MARFAEFARLPKSVQFHYIVGQNFTEIDQQVPICDLNMFALRGETIDMTRIRMRVQSLETSCLFMLDSGVENALA